MPLAGIAVCRTSTLPNQPGLNTATRPSCPRRLQHHGAHPVPRPRPFAVPLPLPRPLPLSFSLSLRHPFPVPCERGSGCSLRADARPGLCGPLARPGVELRQRLCDRAARQARAAAGETATLWIKCLGACRGHILAMPCYLWVVRRHGGSQNMVCAGLPQITVATHG